MRPTLSLTGILILCGLALVACPQDTPTDDDATGDDDDASATPTPTPSPTPTDQPTPTATPTPSDDSDGDGIPDTIDPTPFGSSSNRINGTFTGGLATVVEISATQEVYPYSDDLTLGCDSSWDPQGTLCDEAPHTDDPTLSAKSDMDSGATWNNDNGGATLGEGILVVDAGQLVDFNTAEVFQMFSDGATSHIRFSVHAETGSTPPPGDDPGWVEVTGFEQLGPGDNLDWDAQSTFHTVGSPTTISTGPRVSRYIRFEVRNDGTVVPSGWGVADDIEWYIELRSVKLFSNPLTR